MEYIAVPKGGNVLTSGIKLGRGPRHSTQQTVQYDETGIPNSIPLIPTPVAVASPQPAVQQLPASVQPPVAERTDALTKQPLDLEAEEETRKLETSRWLESHFGSESSFSSAEGTFLPIYSPLWYENGEKAFKENNLTVSDQHVAIDSHWRVVYLFIYFSCGYTF